MTQTVRILFVADSSADIRIFEQELRRGGYEPVGGRVATEAELREALPGENWDMVLSEAALRQFSAAAALRIIRDSGSEAPFFWIADPHGEPAVADMLRAGAQDFVPKREPWRLVSALQRELQAVERRNEAQRSNTELRRSERKYREMVENANSIILRWNREGILTFANAYALEFFGYAKEELLGRGLKLLVPETETSGRDLHGLIDAVMRTPERYLAFENENMRRNGERVYVSWTNRTIRDAHGEIEEFQSIGNDITRLKRVEEALQRNELRFRTFFNSAPVGMAQFSDVGRFLLANQALCRMLGFSENELQTRTYLDITHPRDRAHSEAQFHGMLKGDYGTYTLEKRYLRRDGQAAWVNLSNTAIRDETGKFQYSICTMEDVTQNKRAQEALQASEERFKTLAENAPDVIARFDRQFRILYISPAVETLLEISPGQLMGKSLAEAGIAPERRRLWEGSLQNVFATGSPGLLEFKLETRHGKRALQSRLAPEYGRDQEHGKVESVLAVTRDITDLKEAEAIQRRDKESLERLISERTGELVRAQKELADAKRLSDIGTLAATVAHELRNPLGVIRMAAFNIKRKAPNADLERPLANIEKKIVESDRIISNLLTYARIKPAQYEPAPLHPLVEESLASVQVNYAGVAVERDFEALQDTIIEADAFQLREVLVNIFTNAFQAVQNRPGKVVVRGELLERENTARISVHDNGPGIAPEDLTRVFEPFFTRKSKGTGLGLAIARELVDLHSGKIDITSQPEDGTNVAVTLPRCRPGR